MTELTSAPVASDVKGLSDVHPIPVQVDRLTPAKVRGIGEDILGAQVLIDAYLETDVEYRTDADLTKALGYLGFAQKNVEKVASAAGQQRGHRSGLRETAENLAFVSNQMRAEA